MVGNRVDDQRQLLNNDLEMKTALAGDPVDIDDLGHRRKLFEQGWMCSWVARIRMIAIRPSPMFSGSLTARYPVMVPRSSKRFSLSEVAGYERPIRRP